MSYKRTEYVGSNGQYLNPFFPDSDLTANIFWQYFPIAVRELRDCPPVDRMAMALELLMEGHLIVADVMVHEVDPVTYINLCYNQGYRWVPVMGEPPIAVAPGVNFPGVPSYEANRPPVRSFPISLFAKDYPARDIPVVIQPPPPGLNLVGNWMGRIEGKSIYGGGPGASPSTVERGKKYTAPDGTVVLARVSEAGLIGMGWSVNFLEL